MAAEIEAFQLHFVTTNYGEVLVASGKAHYWMVVLTMVRVIWRELRKVWVEADPAYGSDNPSEILGKYLWGNIQAHQVIDEFLRKLNSARIQRWLRT